MPQQFVIPQYIDAEDKIIGPVTARQFVILLVTGLFVAITYALADFALFLILGIPQIILGAVIAFVRINGQAFHFFILNIVQTFKKPQLRIWRKDVSDKYLRLLLGQEAPPPPIPPVRKEFASHSRLAELTLVVNTGGVYIPEDEDLL